MSGLWVAVTAEFAGSTFSHRATGPETTPDHAVLHVYGHLLDEAGDYVRRGLAGWLPPQTPPMKGAPLSEHKKLRAIEKIVTHQSEKRTPELDAIREVLNR